MKSNTGFPTERSGILSIVANPVGFGEIKILCAMKPTGSEEALQSIFFRHFTRVAWSGQTQTFFGVEAASGESAPPPVSRFGSVADPRFGLAGSPASLC
jgi:hypothetical protein